MAKKVIISSSNELVSVTPEQIAYIQGEGAYSNLKLIDDSEITFSFNLSRFGDILVKQLDTDASTFIRIGKSLIINREYIFRINPSKQQLTLANSTMSKVFTLSASKDALKKVKLLIEKL